ncbi:hypothetical protein VR41_11310 [Streptomyces sp. NRRL B-1568]|nr:hypothetical protein VR41_11310 [Streptomyces sp. NRRL B-1568]
MNLKNSVACALAACCLTAFGVTGMAGGTAQAAAFTAGHDGNATAQLSLQQLTDKVSARIKHDYPNAKLMLADGSSPSGPTKDMSKVTAWRFVFNTPDGPSGVKSVEVPADLSGKIGGIVKHPSPWGGVYAIDKRTPLTPAEAYDILRRAGHDQAYQYVSLVKPLVFKAHLQYHFSGKRGGCNGYAVNVDDHAVNPICG